jgi:hypothetical protein
MALSRNSVFFDSSGQYIHMYIPKNEPPSTSEGQRLGSLDSTSLPESEVLAITFSKLVVLT